MRPIDDKKELTLCGHDDIYVSGDCRACSREYQAKWRQRNRLARALLAAAEARGFSGEEAICALQHIDFSTLQDCVGRGIQ